MEQQTTAKPVTPPTTTVTIPSMQKAAPTLAAAVNTVQARRVPVPKTLKLGNTKDIGKNGSYLHALIYGDTDARKTTTAALFGTPENTRIVMTRRKEQLIPLRDLGYQYAEVTDEASLIYALSYPEQLWPEWASLPDRVLILDDATEAHSQLLDGAEETLEGQSRTGQVKDPRRTYREAGDALRDTLKIVLNKPQHFIMTALARIVKDQFITPDLPPSVLNLVTTEMEFVFYINKGMWQFNTSSVRVQAKEMVEGKERIFSREIFAKYKLPLGLSGKGVIMPNEKMDLAAIWKKVLEGKAVVPTK